MQKKRQFNYLFLVILLGLLFLEGPLFAQNSQNPQETTETPPQEEHNSEDLEALLKKYNKDSEKILEDTGKLHAIEGESKSEVNEKELEAIKLPSKEEEMKALKLAKAAKIEERPPLPTSFSDSVKMALEPLQKLSEADLLKRLDDGLKDSELKPYFEEFPNIKLLSVRLIKDKESLPSLVKILENKDRLIYFVSAMLCTIIFGYILKRAMHREGRPFIIATLMFLLRFFILLGIRLALIQYFFGPEIAPAIKVFKATFMTN